MGPVALLLIVLGVSSSAHAFERTTVQGDPATALWWRHRTVLVQPAADTCGDLSEDAAWTAIARSIATWNAAADGCSDFRIVDDGYPDGLVTNLDGGEHDGRNLIVWREAAWPEEVSGAVLALTTTVHRRSTGQILDADIDLNGVGHTWTTTDDPLDAQRDVENTLTHELGHLLGLAHTDDVEATMYAQTDIGELDKRTLTEDDAAGLCFIYPSGAYTPDAPFVSGRPLTSSCAASAGRTSRWGGWPPLLLAAFSLRRRRRAARRAGRPA